MEQPTRPDCGYCKAPALAITPDGVLVCSGHSDMRVDAFIGTNPFSDQPHGTERRHFEAIHA